MTTPAIRPRADSKRRAPLVAASLIAAVVGGLCLWLALAPGDPGPGQPAQVAGRGAADLERGGGLPVPASQDPPSVQREPEPQAQPAAAATEEAPAESAPAGPLPSIDDTGPGERYMKLYDGQSGRLPRGEPFAVRHGVRPSSPPGVPVLLWTSRRRLDPGDRATLFVKASGEQVQIVSAVAELQAGPVRRPLSMAERGPGTMAADFVADPQLYGGDQTRRAADAAPVLVDLVVNLELRQEGQTVHREVRTMVFLQDSGAALVKGSERMTLTEEGNGQLSVEVDVTRPDHYYLYAELWAVDQERSIAFGRKALGELPAGRQRVEIIFGGQVIRDSGVDGPYAVRNVELMRVSPQPPHQSEPVAQLLVTPPWKASDFR